MRNDEGITYLKFDSNLAQSLQTEGSTSVAHPPQMICGLWKFHTFRLQTTNEVQFLC